MVKLVDHVFDAQLHAPANNFHVSQCAMRVIGLVHDFDECMKLVCQRPQLGACSPPLHVGSVTARNGT